MPNDAYAQQPAVSQVVWKQHATMIFSDIKVVNSAATYNVNAQDNILSNDFTTSGAIAYIQTLENQVCVN